jgi:tRNA nucleotidyltransferase (CCA-adding enzyme)
VIFEIILPEMRPGFLCYNIYMGRNLSSLLERTLDSSRLEILYLLSYQAAMLRMPLYLVGGVVRDILSGRPVKDFDLVLEGNSAEFAEYIVRKFGGKILVHSRFGTATWMLNESTYKRLKVPAFQVSDTPLSFDLISARSETYDFPGALPTVKRAHIDDDLRRRDFTINAMAIRLDGEAFGDFYDPLEGQLDLGGKLIRVLHAGSFIDDPTRIFRAARYAGRYEFEIAPETLRLINEEARKILAQLSGERIRHEFDLIFEERDPTAILKTLNGLNVLSTVHPSLRMADGEKLSVLIDKAEDGFGEFVVPDMLSFRQTLGWILYLLNLPVADIDAIAQRLVFPVLLTKAALGGSALSKELSSIKDWKPSQWTFYLDGLPPLSVYVVYLVTKHASLLEYLTHWRNIKPYTSGYTLQQRGLPPGPKYKEILTRLRTAWLDGEVKSEQEEIDILSSLLTKE